MLTARLLTLRFDALLERFDETPLMQLQRNVPAESIHQHFFLHQETPYLLLVLMCRSDHAEPAAPLAAGKAAEPFAWKQLLNEADQPLFQALRQWRGQRAQSEGLPPYIIASNRQLAEIVKARPSSLAALGRIDGIGKAKLERYGDEILALLAPVGEAAP